MIQVAFGGGVNSTALLVGLHERGERPDYVLFADTGGERAATYAHVDEMSAWLTARGWPAITRVTNAGRGTHGHTSLEDECLRNATLPSKAYGNGGCSVKWKRQPQERYLASREDVRVVWAAGGKVTTLLGIDAGEAHRGKAFIDDTFPRWIYRRPLVEWDWDRDDCVAAIERAGLAVPHKSACFFCPSSKKREVLALASDEPALFERAVAMEHGAAATAHTVRGLGRHWSWEALVRADRAQMRLWPDTNEVPCGCFDGETI